MITVFRSESPKQEAEGAIYDCNAQRLCDGVVQPERARGYEESKLHLIQTLNIIPRDVAQLVARLLWEQDVAGSNPVIPTKIADLTAYCGQIGVNLIRHRRLCTVVP